MPPALPTAGIRTFVRELARADLAFAPAPTATLVPMLVSATLGHGAQWLQPAIETGLEALQQERATSATLAARRLQLVAHVKEALVKSSVLIGVPRSIELLVQLGEFLPADDLRTPFVRSELEENPAKRLLATVGENGAAGLGSIYRHNLDDIFAKFRHNGLEDIRFISQYMTYGLALTPYASTTSSPSSMSSATEPPASPDPFDSDPRLLSVVTLSTLVPQRTAREIHWHLRGALRRGWTRPEVEKLQCAIERVCEACGAGRDVGKGMPRVADVEPLQPEEENGTSGGQ